MPPSQRHTTSRPPSGSVLAGVVPELCSCAPTTTRPSLLTAHTVVSRRRVVGDVVRKGAGSVRIVFVLPSQMPARHRNVFDPTIAVPAALYVEMYACTPMNRPFCDMQVGVCTFPLSLDPKQPYDWPYASLGIPGRP